MSHFAIIAASPHRSEVALEQIMLPFHEFECTGINMHIQDVDETEEKRTEYAEDTDRKLKSPEGELFAPYDNQFYREPTAEELAEIGPIAGCGCGHGLVWSSRDWNDGRGYRAKIQFVPEGYEEVEVSASATQTFAQWLENDGKKLIPFGQQPDLDDEHKYGYVLLDEQGEVFKVIDRTNPNAKWDWWVVGGRWSGLLLGKDGKSADMLSNDSIDWEGMRQKAVEQAMVGYEGWKRARAAAATLDWSIYPSTLSVDSVAAGYKRLSVQKRWDEVDAMKACILRAGDRMKDVPALVEEFNGNVLACAQHFYAMDLMRQDEYGGYWLIGHDTIAAWESPEDEFRALYYNRAPVHAYIDLEGKWHERGEMGWWAICADENDSTYTQDFWQFIESLPPTTTLFNVDCHI